MEVWKIVLITLLSAVVLGGIAGVAIGKHQLKIKRKDYKPLLSLTEKCIYLACIAVGAVFIFIGILNPFSQIGQSGEDGQDGMYMGDIAHFDQEEDSLTVNGGIMLDIDALGDDSDEDASQEDPSEEEDPDESSDTSTASAAQTGSARTTRRQGAATQEITVVARG